MGSAMIRQALVLPPREGASMNPIDGPENEHPPCEDDDVILEDWSDDDDPEADTLELDED
jgi:hypothetical protein